MHLDKVIHSLGIVNKVARVTLGVFSSTQSLHGGVDEVGYSHVLWTPTPPYDSAYSCSSVSFILLFRKREGLKKLN